MNREYCFDHQIEWDELIFFLNFAASETIRESLGFRPFELVFGHSFRGPLKLLKTCSIQEDTKNENQLDHASQFRTPITEGSELARENLQSAQRKLKNRYDRETIERSLNAGDEVFIQTTRKLSNLTYIINNPDCRKSFHICHINYTLVEKGTLILF